MERATYKLIAITRALRWPAKAPSTSCRASSAASDVPVQIFLGVTLRLSQFSLNASGGLLNFPGDFHPGISGHTPTSFFKCAFDFAARAFAHVPGTRFHTPYIAQRGRACHGVNRAIERRRNAAR